MNLAASLGERRFGWARAASLLLVAGLAGCGHKPPPPKPPPPEVGYVVLQTQAVPLQTELPGRTSPYTVSDVRPQVNGIIRARLFREGTDVRAGQVLYQIDPSLYRAAVDQARGTLANAQANLVTTRLKAERYADLVKINAVSRQDYDDAQAAYGQALALVQQDRAALESAQINLAYTRVTAPISGRIGISAYTPGALVTASQTNALTTIQQLDPIYVDVVQSSAQLLQLKRDLALGQVQRGALSARLRLVLEDGSTYPLEGRLEFTGVTVDQNTGAVTLRAIFPNPRAVLLPGMYVRAQVIQAVDPNGILAPQQGVSHDPKGNATALVVNAQNRVEQRDLQVLEAVGNTWLVTQGLKAGDRLIVQGQQRAPPGTLVRPVAVSLSPATPATVASSADKPAPAGKPVSG